MTRLQHTDHLVVTTYSVRSVLGQCKVRDTDTDTDTVIGPVIGQSDDSEPCHTNRVTVIISLSSSRDVSGPEPELLGECGKIKFGATE